MKPLPANLLGTTASTPAQEPCPLPQFGPLPVRRFQVAAWRARDLLPGGKLVYNQRFKLDDPNAIIYVNVEDEQAYRSGTKAVEPLVLRANAGDCMRVTLINRLPADAADGPLPYDGATSNPAEALQNAIAHSSWTYNMVPPIVRGFNVNQVTGSRHVALHAQLVAVNLHRSDGANVGNNEPSTVPPCVQGCPGPFDNSLTATGQLRPGIAAKAYTWYAGDFSHDGKPSPVEFGAIALRDMADVIKHSSHGAIGSLVIEPADTCWTRLDGSHTRVQVWKSKDWLVNGSTECDPNRAPRPEQASFREFVVMYQDDLSLHQNGAPMANLRNGDDAEDSGQKAFNYKTEPLWARLGADPGTEPDAMASYEMSDVLSSVRHGDPETPIFTAKAGTPVRFRVVHPGGHPRNHAFTVFGHDWLLEPWACALGTPDEKCLSRVQGAMNKFSLNRFGTANGIGPARHLNLLMQAGGTFKVPGDYLYRTQEGFMFGAGLWGIFRVEP